MKLIRSRLIGKFGIISILVSVRDSPIRMKTLQQVETKQNSYISNNILHHHLLKFDIR